MDIKDYGLLIRGITSNANYYIGNSVEKYGIKQGQFDYFLMISTNPGINQLELAKRKKVGKASVTKALKILEEEGFIRRLADENDRRNTLCYLTEKGEKIIGEMLAIKSKAEAYLFEGFSEEEKEELLRFLNMLYVNSETLGSKL